MSDADNEAKSPWPARFGLAAAGCMPILFGVMFVAAQGKAVLNAPDVGGVLGLVLTCVATFGVGGGLLWLAATYRVLSRAELEALDSDPLPTRSNDLLVCRFSWLNRGVRRVVVDFEFEQIEFRHCHTPRKFLALPQAEYHCRFADLVDIHRDQGRGDSLTIVTTTGKALVPSTATDYETLCGRLPDWLPERRPVVDIENPLMGILYVTAAVVGLFVGLALTPRAAGVWEMAGLMAVGAGVGIFVINAAVRIVNAETGRSIVPALAGAILGAAAGFFLGYKLVEANQWSVWVAVAAGVVGAATGFVVGLRNSRRGAP